MKNNKFWITDIRNRESYYTITFLPLKSVNPTYRTMIFTDIDIVSRIFVENHFLNDIPVTIEFLDGSKFIMT